MFMTDAIIKTGKSSCSELPEVATRAEVSAYTRVSIPTLARWAGEGRGPRFRRAGGRVLYLRADVTAWLESLEAGGEAR